MKYPAFVTSLKDKLRSSGYDDPRILGLVVIAVIGLSVVWSGIGIVQKNYQLQQKVTVLEEQNAVLALQNANKQLQNEYLKTPEFAELKARRVNGVAAPGEQVYIISDEVAQAALKTPEQEELVTEPPSSVVEKPFYQENFESWISFFFGG